MTGSQKTFGEHSPRATGGYQDETMDESMARAEAKKMPCGHVDKNMPERTSQPNHVGGSYAGT